MAGFVEETAALLERTPRVLEALLDGLPEAWLQTPDSEGGWRAWDVVGHLISGELNNWIPRIEILLEEGVSRPFEPFDRFEHLEREAGVPLEALVDRFGVLRSRNLLRLRELVVDDSLLERCGLHPQFGEVTLRQVLAAWTVHDLDHIAQIFSSLAGSRDVEVGPYDEFLGILLRRRQPAG